MITKKMDEFVQKYGIIGSCCILICSFNIAVMSFDLIFKKTSEDFIFDRNRIIFLIIMLITQIAVVWMVSDSYNRPEKGKGDDDLY